jgi:hypothetical protein
MAEHAAERNPNRCPTRLGDLTCEWAIRERLRAGFAGYGSNNSWANRNEMG